MNGPHLEAEHPLGKGEVVSSILTGSTIEIARELALKFFR